MRAFLVSLWLSTLVCHAHDAHGRSTAPPEARRLKSPLSVSAENAAAARPSYEQLCASCHGADGKARTPVAGKLPMRPTDLAGYLMQSMRDGEIYWVIANGIDQHMPASGRSLMKRNAGKWCSTFASCALIKGRSRRRSWGPTNGIYRPAFLCRTYRTIIP